MFTSLFAQVGLIVTVAVCTLAIWLGGRPERSVGWASLVAWLASAVAQDRRFASIFNPAILAVDLAFLLFLGALSLRTARTWLLFATAYQLLTTVTDLLLAIDPRLGVRTFITASYLWSYLTLLSLVVGTWSAWQLRGGKGQACRAAKLSS